mmetsp:Transcript_13656/g.9820  ORF Transcript_13656/g.9820 Transcript_13656/m.9820 type:complete len:117 (+) Transcript_13656:1016-1366(+)
MERQMAWEDEDLHDLGLKIVILENIYTPEEVSGEEAEMFLEELEVELRAEIEASIGPVVKMEFYKNNPAGVVKLKFASALHAEQCVKAMHGRYFDARQIQCYFWDGKTDYRIVKES